MPVLETIISIGAYTALKLMLLPRLQYWLRIR